jgi:hypothetical protein
MNISISNETASAITVDTLVHDLRLIDEMLAELALCPRPLPACKKLDKKQFKAYRKSILDVLSYYGWKP